MDRFRYQANKARQAQSRVKMLERLTAVAEPESLKEKVLTFPEPEALSPPIVNLENAAVGYDGSPVLQHLNLRIDQDDRIALLGRNGEGKSTFAKLLAEKLLLLNGTVTRAARLRVGYFAQHQIDELDPDATPLQHLTKARPEASKAWARSRLAGFGLTAEQVDTTALQLSGGEKARLSLLLATLDAPHLLILDEPTNHLDIEGRDALVVALTQYSGAIILVTHDMHLLGLVADRLWLVQGGTVTPYDDDLEAYRDLMLHPPTVPVEKPKPVAPVRVSRSEIASLRAEVRKCETRLAKLNEMRDQLAVKLSDPALYEAEMGAQAETWQKKYAEVMDGLARGEALWTGAMAKLEQALAQSA